MAYDQLVNGANNAATAGRGDRPLRRQFAPTILNAEESMYTGGVSPRAALASAESSVNATIASYNSRLGVS